MRINVNGLDDELWQEAVAMANKNGCSKNQNKGILEFILEDYIQLRKLNELDDPLLIKKFREILNAELALTEKRLGGRLFTLVGDNTINLSVLAQIMYSSVTKFDDQQEAMAILEKYRMNAVDNLRTRQKPITYTQLIKGEEFDG